MNNFICPHCDRQLKCEQAYYDHLKFSKACAKCIELNKIEENYDRLLQRFQELYQSHQNLLKFLASVNINDRTGETFCNRQLPSSQAD